MPNEWQQITVNIPASAPLQKHPLRIDPLNTMGMIWISKLQLVDASTDQVFWSATAENNFADCDNISSLLLIGHKKVLILAATGTDPIITTSHHR